MTREAEAQTVGSYARGIATRMSKTGMSWTSKEDVWWYLSQLASKVNELERTLVAKNNVTDLAHDIGMFAMIIDDLQINNAKKKKTKKKAVKKKAVTKKAAKKKVTRKK